MAEKISNATFIANPVLVVFPLPWSPDAGMPVVSIPRNPDAITQRKIKWQITLNDIDKILCVFLLIIS
ncbi:hypothetical protein [Aquitalea magnusonii]|nr:hypothetical protein [Aquitalea magnusonii]